jgi:hypothetical protein
LRKTPFFSPKIVKIAENCDHNIDPCFFPGQASWPLRWTAFGGIGEVIWRSSGFLATYSEPSSPYVQVSAPTPGPQWWTSIPGVNFDPRGELRPHGECSPLCSPPGVNTLYYLEEWRSKQRIKPPGDNFTLGGQNSPLEDNFAPGGQSLRLWAKLRIGLSDFLRLPRLKMRPTTKIGLTQFFVMTQKSLYVSTDHLEANLSSCSGVQSYDFWIYNYNASAVCT